MSGYVITNALEADGETLLDEVEKDLDLDTTRFVTVQDIDQTIAGNKTFSKPLTVTTPINPTHATTKEYVENYVSTHTGGGGNNAHFQTIQTKDLKINTTDDAEGRILFTEGANAETINASIMLDFDGGVSINSNHNQVNVNQSKIINLVDGTDAGDAVNTKQFTDGLNTKLDLAGGTLTGVLNMNYNKITGVASGTTDTDAVNFRELASGLNKKLNLTGGTLTGGLNMGSNKITGVASGTTDTDAVNKKQLSDGLTTKLDTAGGLMTGNLILRRSDKNPHILFDTAEKLTFGPTQANPFIHFNNTGDFQLIELMKDINCHGTINMKDNKTITNLPTPTQATEAVNKGYVDTAIANIPPPPSFTPTQPSVKLTSTNNIDASYNERDVYSFLLETPNTEYTKLTIKNKNEGWPSNDGATMIDFQTQMSFPLGTAEGSGRIVSKSIDGSNYQNCELQFFNCNDYTTTGGGGSLEQIMGLSKTVNMYKNVDMKSKRVRNVSNPLTDQDVATKQYVDFSRPIFKSSPFFGSSFQWKAVKFNYGSSVKSGRFLFDADFSVWNSDVYLNRSSYKAHNCYLYVRMVTANNVVVSPETRFVFPFSYMVNSQWQPAGSLAPGKIYYSNANLHTKIQYTLNDTEPLGDFQFQYTWLETTVSNANMEGVLRPTDGFCRADVSCTRYDI